MNIKMPLVFDWHVSGFNNRNLHLATNLILVSLKTFLQQDLTDAVIYVDFNYKFKRTAETVSEYDQIN